MLRSLILGTSLLIAGAAVAQCPTTGSPVHIEFGQAQLIGNSCDNDSFVVQVHATNIGTQPALYSSFALRVDYNQEMLGDPVAHSAFGTVGITQVGSAASIGIINLQPTDTFLVNQSELVATVTFPVLTRTTMNPDCVDLHLNDGQSSAPTTAQQWIAFQCQPASPVSLGNADITQCLQAICCDSKIDVEPTCVGQNAGQAVVTPAVANSNFMWSSGQTTAAIFNLGAGSYTVTISDSACSFVETVIIEELDASATTLPACDGEGGSAEVLPTLSGMNIFWSNGATTAKNTNLVPGAYTVTVSAPSCSVIESVTVADQVFDITASIQASTGANDGSITLFFNNVPPLKDVIWSNGFVGPNLNHVAPGTYTATITALSGCSVQRTYEVGTISSSRQIEASAMVYPSPAQSTAAIRSSVLIEVVELIDMAGKAIHTQAIGAFEGQLDLHGVAPGTYVLRVHTVQGTRNQLFTRAGN